MGMGFCCPCKANPDDITDRKITWCCAGLHSATEKSVHIQQRLHKLLFDSDTRIKLRVETLRNQLNLPDFLKIWGEIKSLICSLRINFC